MSGVLDKIIKLNSMTTDSTGAFRLSGVPENAHPYPYARKDGYATSPEIVRPPDPTRIALWPAGKISGKLVDKAGKAVHGMKLHIMAEDFLFHSRAEVTTDADGSFATGWILPASYVIQIDAPAKVTAKALTGLVVTEGETLQAPDMVAIRGALVRGRVVDAKTGEPVALGTVHASGPMSPSSSGYNMVTLDKTGSFEFRVYPGVNRLQFQGREKYAYDYPNVSLDVGDYGLSNVKLEANPADSVIGRVVDESGAAVAGAAVSIGNSWQKVSTDENGKFEAYLAPEPKDEWMPTDERDRVVVRASDPDNDRGVVFETKRQALLANDDLVIIVRPAYKLTVTVKSTDGTPIEGIEAEIWADNGRGSSNEGRVTTDAEGKAEFSVYRGGWYYPNGRGEGYYRDRSIRFLPRVGTDEWTGEAELIMEPATRTQKGKVVDADGNPVPMIRVTLDYDLSVITDTNGEFALGGLPDSRVDINVQTAQFYGRAVVDKDTEYAIIELKPIPR